MISVIVYQNKIVLRIKLHLTGRSPSKVSYQMSKRNHNFKSIYELEKTIRRNP